MNPERQRPTAVTVIGLLFLAIAGMSLLGIGVARLGLAGPVCAVSALLLGKVAIDFMRLHARARATLEVLTWLVLVGVMGILIRSWVIYASGRGGWLADLDVLVSSALAVVAVPICAVVLCLLRSATVRHAMLVQPEKAASRFKIACWARGLQEKLLAALLRCADDAATRRVLTKCGACLTGLGLVLAGVQIVSVLREVEGTSVARLPEVALNLTADPVTRWSIALLAAGALALGLLAAGRLVGRRPSAPRAPSKSPLSRPDSLG